MKCFAILILFVTLSLVVTERISIENLKSPKYESDKEQCMQEEKVSAQELKQFEESDHKKPSHNLKCFMKCIWEKNGAIKNDEMDYDNLKELITKRFDAEVAKKVMDKCQTVKGSDLCDTAHMFNRCLITV